MRHQTKRSLGKEELLAERYSEWKNPVTVEKPRHKPQKSRLSWMLTGRMASYQNNHSQNDFLQVILSLLIHLTVKSRQNRDPDVSQIGSIACETSVADGVCNESIT
jgi:hypothetical protein